MTPPNGAVSAMVTTEKSVAGTRVSALWNIATDTALAPDSFKEAQLLPLTTPPFTRAFENASGEEWIVSLQINMKVVPTLDIISNHISQGLGAWLCFSNGGKARSFADVFVASCAAINRLYSCAK